LGSVFKFQRGVIVHGTDETLRSIGTGRPDESRWDGISKRDQERIGDGRRGRKINWNQKRAFLVQFSDDTFTSAEGN